MPPKKQTKADRQRILSEHEKKAEQAEKEERDKKAKLERENAARELADSMAKGPGPPPFWIMDCVAKLRDPQCKTQLRERAARKLQEGMEEASSYVAFFAGALSCAVVGDEDDDVRQAASNALGALGEAGVPYVDALTSAMTADKCHEVRSAAATAMTFVCWNSQKKAARAMCDNIFKEVTKNENLESEVYEEIVTGFGNATRKAVPLLRLLMKKQTEKASDRERELAAEKLCKHVLRDSDENVLLCATQAFSGWLVLGLPALQKYCQSFLYKTDRTKLSKAVETLLPVAMNDPDADVRQAATTSLCELECSTEPMFKVLAETLHEDSNIVKRLRAAQTFASFMKVSDHMAAETLHEQGHCIAHAAMEDTNPGVRQAAAAALGASVKEAGPYVEDLVESLKDDDPEHRRGAVRALGAIGEAALPRIQSFFVAILDDSDFSVRYWAAEGLGKMGDSAVLYINVLAAVALYDVDPEKQARSNDAIGAVGKLAGPVVDDFSVFEDEDEQARQERAAKWLDELGVPYTGLVIAKEESGKRVAGKAAANKRGDRKRGDNKGRFEDSFDSPKIQVNRDFACDVGKFLSDLAQEAENQGLAATAEIEGEAAAPEELAPSTATPKAAASPEGQGRKSTRKSVKH